MKKQMTVAACVFHLFYSFPLAAQSGEYTLIKKEGRISMSEKWIEVRGQKTRELKLEFIVQADICDVVKLLTSQPQGKAWNNSTSEYKILPTTSANAWITYIKYDVPWPLKDQDCCILYQLTGDGKYSEISFSSVENRQFPATKDAGRITGAKGKWVLQSMGAGGLSVVYTVSTDRSKTIPQYISDPIVQKQFFKNFNNFISLLEDKEI